MVANLGSDQGATPAPSSTQLTRPSLFILIATLALAGAYQPASESFVFGPSSRFWRISPISSFVELYMIVKRVLRAVFRAAKSAFIVATHVDANLTNARLAYTVGTTREGDQPSQERLSDDIRLEDVEAFDLGTGPYQDAWEYDQNNHVAYDVEMEIAESGWPRNALERVQIFVFMFWNHLLVVSYCLVIARAMNASTGSAKYLELKESRNNLHRRHQFYQATLHEMHENWRFRLGISLPTLAQYIKIMVVTGITIPKILASIYFCHWLVLETLLTLAIFCKQNYKDLTRNVDAYLSNPYYHTTDIVEESESSETDADDDGLFIDGEAHLNELGKAHRKEMKEDEAKLRKEIQRWPYNEKEHGLVLFHLFFLCFGLPMITFWESSVTIHVITMLLWFGFAVALRIKRYVYVEGNLKYVPGSRVGKRKLPLSRRKDEPIYGGYVVGGDLGLGCLVLWALWCILCYDSDGTSRPSWPWLDFLG